MTTVKVKLENDIRRFTIYENTTLELFNSLLSQVYGIRSMGSYLLTYSDERNNIVFINSTEALRDGISLANKQNPPIFRVTLVRSEMEKPKIESNSTGTIKDFSNWTKKNIQDDSKEEKDHIVKICGKPFVMEENNSEKVVLEPFNLKEEVKLYEKEEIPTIRSKKITLKETVENISEEQKNKTLKVSEDIKEKTLQYSNIILEETIPLTKTIYESSVSSSESISNKLSHSPAFDMLVNYDDIVNNVSSKQEEYISNISKDIDDITLGIKEQNEPIFKKIFTSSEDIAQGTLHIVNEKSKQIIHELDQIKSKVNTDVNIKYREEINTSTTEMESKLNTLSTTTTDTTINISDNIAKTILSI